MALTSRAVDVPDDLPGDLAVAHAPLRVQREAHVGLLEPLLQPRRLREEVRAPGLDVEQQQRLRLAGRLEVAADHGVGLARAVHAVLARVGVGDHRDQLERREHRTVLALVRLGLAREPARRALRRADPERAELAALRRPVVRHDAELGQDAAPAARELDLGRLALLGGRPARLILAASTDQHDREDHHERRHSKRRQAAPQVGIRRLAHRGRVPVGLRGQALCRPRGSDA